MAAERTHMNDMKFDATTTTIHYDEPRTNDARPKDILKLSCGRLQS